MLVIVITAEAELPGAPFAMLTMQPGGVLTICRPAVPQAPPPEEPPPDPPPPAVVPVGATEVVVVAVVPVDVVVVAVVVQGRPDGRECGPSDRLRDFAAICREEAGRRQAGVKPGGESPPFGCAAISA